MWDVVIAVAVVLWCMLSVMMTALRLPGTWSIVVAAAAYGLWTDWQAFGAGLIAILVGIAVAGEVIELIASAVTARKAGASRQAAWGGLIGGFLGMIFLSFLVPIPFVGTMAGALVGCFAGAMIAELRVRKKLDQGAKVGFFSAIGFVLGTVAKIAIAMAMSVIFVGFVLMPIVYPDTATVPVP